MTISLFLLENDRDIGDPILNGKGHLQQLQLIKKQDNKIEENKLRKSTDDSERPLSGALPM